MMSISSRRAGVLKVLTLAVVIACALAGLRAVTLTDGINVPESPSSNPVPSTGTGIVVADYSGADAGTDNLSGASGKVQPINEFTRLTDIAPRLPDAIVWCNHNFRNLKNGDRLSIQKTFHLSDCLYARYVSEQREKDENIMVRSFWEQVTRLSPDAPDSRLVAAWLHPHTVRTAP